MSKRNNREQENRHCEIDIITVPVRRRKEDRMPVEMEEDSYQAEENPTPVARRAYTYDPSVCRRCGQPLCDYCGLCHQGGCYSSQVMCVDVQEAVMYREDVPEDGPLPPAAPSKPWWKLW